MKELLCAAIAASLFTGSAVAGSRYNSSESKFEIKYAHYNLDLGGTSEDAPGLNINYGYKSLTTGFGVDFDIEGFEYESINVYKGEFGLNYTLPLDLERVTITPEVGMFHADIEGSTDSGYFAGAEVSAEIIPRTLHGSVYIKHYDFEYDVWEVNWYGAKLSYEFDKDTFLEFGIRDAGTLTRFDIGFGFIF